MANGFKRGDEVVVYWPGEPHITIDIRNVSSVSGGVVFVNHRGTTYRFDAETCKGVKRTNPASSIRLATDEDRAEVWYREARATLTRKIQAAAASLDRVSLEKLRAIVAAIEKEG